MALITRPSVVFPPFKLDQDELLAALVERHPGAGDAVTHMRATGVRTRYMTLPLDELLARRPFGLRNGRYAREAVRLGTAAADRALQIAGITAGDVDHLVFVSCTGYMLPGPDAYIAAELGCRATMRRTPIQQLGCAAGVSAVAEAYHFVTSHPGSNALVVAVELSSLSYQPDHESISDFISNALFSDGAAAAVVSSTTRGGGVELTDSMQHLLEGSTDVIYGETSEIGFHFWTNPSVRRAVPQVVPALQQFVAMNGWEPSQLDFCVSHTGGPAILDAVEKGLALPAGMLDPSRQSLAEVGNCSSVSVFDVLERHHESPPDDGARGMMVAFGPGFTTEALLGQWVAAPARRSQQAEPGHAVPSVAA